jgi:hypothetical protein
MPKAAFLKTLHEDHHTKRERLGTSIYEKIRGPLFHMFSFTSLQQLLGSKCIVQEILPLGGQCRRVSPTLFCHHFIWRCCKK